MIKRPERNVPVWGEYDVAGAGGGVAAAAMAVASGCAMRELSIAHIQSVLVKEIP